MEKYQSMDCHLIQYQILQSKMISNVWQKVRRITKETMRVKELIEVLVFEQSYQKKVGL